MGSVLNFGRVRGWFSRRWRRKRMDGVNERLKKACVKLAGENEELGNFECVVCRWLLEEPVTTCKGETLCRGCYDLVRRDKEWERLFSAVDWETGRFVDVVIRDLQETLYSEETALCRRLKAGERVNTGDLKEKSRVLLAQSYRLEAEKLVEDGEVNEGIEHALLSVAVHGFISEEMVTFLLRVSKSHPDHVEVEESTLEKVEEKAWKVRAESLPEKMEKMERLECFCCSEIFFDPCTYPTGQTTCRDCILRALEVTNPQLGTAAPPTCPMTREPLERFAAWIHADPENLKSNKLVERLVRHLAPEEYEAFKTKAQKELEEFMSEENFVPIFVCMMAWPGQECPLHVFEPRYRLMMRRCVHSGFRMFGMCSGAEEPYSSVGTMLYIRKQTILSDGRSLLDTVGRKRFRILERGVRDGYNIARIQYFDDKDCISRSISTDEEQQAREAILSQISIQSLWGRRWNLSTPMYRFIGRALTGTSFAPDRSRGSG